MDWSTEAPVLKTRLFRPSVLVEHRLVTDGHRHRHGHRAMGIASRR